MSERIHSGWLRPMPRYWQDFYERDHPLLEADCDLPSVNKKGERECEFCGDVFDPKTPQSQHRIICYSPECEQARKRRNARLSARRVAARKRAQQA